MKKLFCDRCRKAIPDTETYFSGGFVGQRQSSNRKMGDLCMECWREFEKFMRLMEVKP